MSEAEKNELINFIAQYNGKNDFLLSLKKWHHDGKTLTPKQFFVASLEYNRRKRIAEKAAVPQVPQVPQVTQVTQEINQPKKVSETMQSVVYETLNPVETKAAPQGETPNLDGIEAMLAKIAGQVVADSMTKAEAKLGAIIAKAEAAAGMQRVMHVRVNGGEVKKLSTEAHELLADCLTVVNTRANNGRREMPLLVGPKGCGKTTLAKQVAESMGLSFSYLCLSAGASETWFFGRQLPTGIREAEFSRVYENGGVFLIDEIDAADANMTMALNTSLDSDCFYNPITDKMVKRHKDFVCIAAANTFGLGGNAQYTGRNRLDAAFLERFVPMELDYSEKLEKTLTQDKKLLKLYHKARKALMKRNSSEALSTRWLLRIESLVNSGWTIEKAIKSMTASWPEGLAKEIGLLDGIEENEAAAGEPVPF